MFISEPVIKRLGRDITEGLPYFAFVMPSHPITALVLKYLLGHDEIEQVSKHYAKMSQLCAVLFARVTGTLTVLT